MPSANFVSGSDFNPLPSCEGRPRRRLNVFAPNRFQSTPLMRGETRLSHVSADGRTISIHSPHARGDVQYFGIFFDRDISIHSPHARGDSAAHAAPPARCISIHSPHVRGDQHLFSFFNVHLTFQSTPLMRGETSERHVRFRGLQISIHSPHARGDGVVVERVLDGAISIHSPHARGDATPAHATPAAEHISIHSPHARGDKRC